MTPSSSIQEKFTPAHRHSNFTKYNPISKTSTIPEPNHLHCLLLLQGRVSSNAPTHSHHTLLKVSTQMEASLLISRLGWTQTRRTRRTKVLSVLWTWNVLRWRIASRQILSFGIVGKLSVCGLSRLVSSFRSFSLGFVGG